VSVITRVDVEPNRDQAPIVLVGDGLGMEVEDSGGLVRQHGIVEVLLPHIRVLRGGIRGGQRKTRVKEYGVAKTKIFYRINQDYCSYRSRDYH